MRVQKLFLITTCCILAVLAAVPNTASAQYTYSSTPLKEVINEVRDKTGFRFLYREAMIADVSLSFTSPDDLILMNLREHLKAKNLDLNVDSTRRQAVIYKRATLPSPGSRPVTISGYAVDALSGERLPYATVTWSREDVYSGVSTNQSGAFTIKQELRSNRLELKCSYVGYTTASIHIDLNEPGPFEDVTFRMEPELIDGNELVVTGSNYYDQVNERTAGLVDIGTFSPLGESNTMRALQTLPAVSLTPALSDGLHIRGSTGDGFHVMVDGITIFNQSHLFGLLDSFNADVLRRSGFYYDIAPAQYQAPPGGTLSMVTRTGSLNKVEVTAGVSNTAYRLTLEGPLAKGKSSWLLSGRSSYMNTINWFNNADLIKWGLDVDRPRGLLEDNLVNIESRLVQPGATDASFHDFHGKIYFEGENGGRFMISGYYGGDDTEQFADRLYQSFRSTKENLKTRQVVTRNNWNNGSASFKYQAGLSQNVHSHTNMGLSIYNTGFFKEDFTYTRLNTDNSSFRMFTYPFSNKSILNELKAGQQFDISLDPLLITTGIDYYYHLGEYYEDSFNRLGFLTSRRSHKVDLFGQLDYTGLDFVRVSAGSRLHYYSNGQYVRWSPRLKFRVFPQNTISVGVGYSLNYQFLNKISLRNTVTSDVWVLANSDQPPTEANYYTLGLYLDPQSWLYVQVEGYFKEMKNVRLHEINEYSLTGTFRDSPLFADNSGEGYGLEFLLANRFRLCSITQTLALSTVELFNPLINGGSPFYPEWDRRYRYTAALEMEPVEHFSVFLSWMYASGAPNQLSAPGAEDESRLDDYMRSDLSVEYKRAFKSGSLRVSLSVFNLFNRRNPWYRELTPVIDRNNGKNRFRSVPVDVYDIGFQPSFELKIGF